MTDPARSAFRAPREWIRDAGLAMLRAVRWRIRDVRIGRGRGGMRVVRLASTPGPPGPNEHADFDPLRAWAHLETQCAFGPRAPGTAGHRHALRWLLEQLGDTCDDVAIQR
jgi:hypothetical protein